MEVIYESIILSNVLYMDFVINPSRLTFTVNQANPTMR